MYLNEIKEPQSGYCICSILGKKSKGLERGIFTILNEMYCLAEVHVLDLELVFKLLS